MMMSRIERMRRTQLASQRRATVVCVLGVVLVALDKWGESLAGMLSCDYNGWTDAPADEREELERY